MTDGRSTDGPAVAAPRDDEVDAELAPAKVNLALHVTGRRDDGYHLLDTLVVHGGAADRVAALRRPPAEIGAGEAATLSLAGPMATGLAAEADNLVLRAARLLAAEARRLGRAVAPVVLRLEKHLPIASGVGGGSSDAAATLRLLDRLWGLGLGRARLAELALPLGADVPMCVWGEPLRARGVGETIERLAPLPPFRLVLANPGVPVSTPSVFRALTRRDNPPLPDMPPRFADLDALVAWLAATRNDLEAAAISLAPEIATVLGRLRATPGCRLARMSGSGATCWGLFATTAAADFDAASTGWWTARSIVA
ncbi:MAG: 4-(cytidine 5'-diphospho)-2-C-methyl-D-erythritol kinase [Hyphomicrobiales bacterium]|nr:4-(cytidine 5'-diphospho)-2-C-methyl-D-erythritol kinase [Hyphomicrobiales bacterium]